MSVKMDLGSLLLSDDAAVVRIVRPTLEKLGIEVELSQLARKATDLLINEKFDAVIIDGDDVDGGLEVLQGLRATSTNKNSIAIAILNGRKTTIQQAFEIGANFVLQKPVSALNASRCFNAALNSMLRERRRYFRQPVKMPVKVTLGDQEWTAASTNISEGGIALLLHKALPKNAVPRLQFTLPGTHATIYVSAVVAWADIKGFSGLRFQDLEPSSKELLEQWLSRHMEAHLRAE
jgi:DNA-binding response OmpR family regulator